MTKSASHLLPSYSSHHGWRQTTDIRNGSICQHLLFVLILFSKENSCPGPYILLIFPFGGLQAEIYIFADIWINDAGKEPDHPL